jgi:hypothetical protein
MIVRARWMGTLAVPAMVTVVIVGLVSDLRAGGGSIGDGGSQGSTDGTGGTGGTGGAPPSTGCCAGFRAEGSCLHGACVALGPADSWGCDDLVTEDWCRPSNPPCEPEESNCWYYTAVFANETGCTELPACVDR